MVTVWKHCREQQTRNYIGLLITINYLFQKFFDFFLSFLRDGMPSKGKPSGFSTLCGEVRRASPVFFGSGYLSRSKSLQIAKLSEISTFSRRSDFTIFKKIEFFANATGPKKIEFFR